MIRRWFVFPLVLTLMLAPGFGQSKKKSDDDKFRMVHGTIVDAEEHEVEGAVVQLKNTKTLQVRSFISQAKGAYYFHGLDPNIDYTLKADYQGASSAVRTLSSFDSRKQPVLNLKLEPKK